MCPSLIDDGCYRAPLSSSQLYNVEFLASSTTALQPRERSSFPSGESGRDPYSHHVRACIDAGIYRVGDAVEFIGGQYAGRRGTLSEDDNSESPKFRIGSEEEWYSNRNALAFYHELLYDVL